MFIVEESLFYLHNFKSKFIPKLQVYFKRKQKHFRTKRKAKRRQGLLIDKIPSVLANAIESFVSFQLMGLGILIVTKSLRKFLKLN